MAFCKDFSKLNFTNILDVLFMFDSHMNMTLICINCPMITQILHSKNENKADYASCKNEFSQTYPKNSPENLESTWRALRVLSGNSWRVEH